MIMAIAPVFYNGMISSTPDITNIRMADDAKAAEELRRAQEIIDRLNREAAEDEAKKQAELDAAKAAAAERFGE